jgi:hypothetical protein
MPVISEARLTYPPLNTLKAVADGIWIADGPVIWFGMPWPKLPFPTRMTVVKLEGGGLFIHSPTALDARLKAEIAQLGTPRYLVAPNRLHYWWIPDWHAAFPGAEVFVAEKVIEQARGRLNFACSVLDRDNGYSWDSDIATLRVAGRYMSEVEFFHRASRTLVLTDLIENFEEDKIDSLLLRLAIRFGGVRSPHGGMPRDLRMTFPRDQLRANVRKMIDWNPERIIIAHGRWFERDGRAELLRAFQWLLA